MRTNEIEYGLVRPGMYPETSAVWSEHLKSTDTGVWRVVWRPEL